MPAVITHYLLGKQVLASCRDTVSCEEAFLLGVQGPDILFFFRAYPWMPGKPGLMLGNALHEVRPSRLFDTMRALCREAPEEDREILESYVYGFLCHYAADRTIHPFVCAMQSDMQEQEPQFAATSDPYHYRIESALDTWLLSSACHQAVTHFSLTTVVPKVSCQVSRALAWLYHRLLSETLNAEVSEQQLRHLAADMRQSMFWMTDHTGFKRWLFLGLERVSGRGPWLSTLVRTPKIAWYDFANTAHRELRYDGRVIRKDFAAVCEDAVLDAQALIHAYMVGADGVSLTADVDFTGRLYQEKGETS